MSRDDTPIQATDTFSRSNICICWILEIEGPLAPQLRKNKKKEEKKKKKKKKKKKNKKKKEKKKIVLYTVKRNFQNRHISPNISSGTTFMFVHAGNKTVLRTVTADEKRIGTSGNRTRDP